MATPVRRLPGIKLANIPEFTPAHLHPLDDGEYMALMNRHAQAVDASELLAAESADRPLDYARFLRAAFRRAQEQGTYPVGQTYFIARSLPVPNLLTFIYDQLNVTSAPTHHAREIGNTGLSAMSLATQFDDSRSDAVSLKYLRPKGSPLAPQALVTFFEGSGVVHLQAYAALTGSGDIGEVPGVHQALLSDVRFAAEHIAAEGEPRA